MVVAAAWGVVHTVAAREVVHIAVVAWEAAQIAAAVV